MRTAIFRLILREQWSFLTDVSGQTIGAHLRESKNKGVPKGRYGITTTRSRNRPEECSSHDAISFILPEGLGTDVSEKRESTSFRVEDGDNKVSTKSSYLATKLYGVKSKTEIFTC